LSYPAFQDYVRKFKDIEGLRKTETQIDREVYGNARNFLLEVIKSMKKEERLPLADEMIFMTQEIFLNKPVFQMNVWQELSRRFPNIITIEKEIAYSDELQNFDLDYKSIYETHIHSSVSITKRWEILSRDYPKMAELAKAILVLPYSTAPVESTFSKFKALKTPYRNRLYVENLEASIIVEPGHARILP